MNIDCDFPGGNILVDQIGPSTVKLRQDLRDTRRDWFYWYFRIRGAAGRTVRFEFTASLALGTRGPAISRDDARSWNWLSDAPNDDRSFTYHFAADEEDVRFSFAMPYVLSDWQRFADARPWLMCDTLAQTRGGRDVPLARLGNGPRQILLAARHHCCEMMPNYSLEGFIDAVHDDPLVADLCHRATIHIIPLVDLDGVQAGDQGKDRRPRDHGRDYLGASLYPEIAALRALLERIKPSAIIDLHCPWVRGPYNENIYLVGADSPAMESAQRRFSATLQSVARGPLPFDAAEFLPFGTAWNTRANMTDGQSLSRFGASLGGCGLSTTIELPYANAGSVEVNRSSATAFGHDLARALARWVAV